MKSLRRWDGGDDDLPAGRNAEPDFRGKRRSYATRASATDPDARLYRKAKAQSSRLCYMGHLLMENANAPIVDAALTPASGTAERLPGAWASSCRAALTPASGTAEREAALAMLQRQGKRQRITLADNAHPAPRSHLTITNLYLH